jgi:L-fuculose-phosphate aldolase
MTIAEAREELVEYGHRLIRDRLTVGTAGNLSLLVDEALAITPSGVPYDRVAAADIVLVDPDGTPRDGGTPSSELPLHRAIYASTDAGAVVHTHSPYATALATVFEDELPPIHYTTAILGGPVPVVPYSTYGTQELADACRAALTDRSAALLQSHGVVAYGSTLPEAYERAQLVEWLAEVYTHASRVGEPRLFDAAELEKVGRKLNSGRDRGLGA